MWGKNEIVAPANCQHVCFESSFPRRLVCGIFDVGVTSFIDLLNDHSWCIQCYSMVSLKINTFLYDTRLPSSNWDFSLFSNTFFFKDLFLKWRQLAGLCKLIQRWTSECGDAPLGSVQQERGAGVLWFAFSDQSIILILKTFFFFFNLNFILFPRPHQMT